MWNRCVDYLQDELPAQQFNTWIRPLIYSRDEHSDTITLFAPNKFVVDWVEKNYLGKIILYKFVIIINVKITEVTERQNQD